MSLFQKSVIIKYLNTLDENSVKVPHDKIYNLTDEEIKIVEGNI